MPLGRTIHRTDWSPIGRPKRRLVNIAERQASAVTDHTITAISFATIQALVGTAVKRLRISTIYRPLSHTKGSR